MMGISDLLSLLLLLLLLLNLLFLGGGGGWGNIMIKDHQAQTDLVLLVLVKPSLGVIIRCL